SIPRSVRGSSRGPAFGRGHLPFRARINDPAASCGEWTRRDSTDGSHRAFCATTAPGGGGGASPLGSSPRTRSTARGLANSARAPRPSPG
ncbi:MAG TPA: hypothetical protein P5102_18100, partial [Candidatus Competibacteraceae bacterium]|nr:hypothetical protein [Candidatus Competibacteraceae bacterium]HSA45506.1 hypothetical protein [Candidatus Competibacteraceae bacterium]